MVRDMLVRHLGIVSGICSPLGAQWNLGATSRISGRAYESLIYPDMFFIPLYFLAATLLFRRHWLGASWPLRRPMESSRHDLSLSSF